LGLISGRDIVEKKGTTQKRDKMRKTGN